MTGEPYTGVAGLRIDVAGGVLHLTLDRPEKRNALDDEMVAALIRALEAAGPDESVRAVHLRGEGSSFCGGADIVARNTAGGPKPRVGSIQRRLPTQAHRLIPAMLTLQAPIVCTVRGWAAGIGMVMALAADVTIAANDATFWAPYVERGFTPDSGAAWLLPRRIGETRARRMLLLGEKVDGRTAAEWGLVDRAVPDSELDDVADDVVTTMAQAPTVALGLTKWLLNTGRWSSFDDHLQHEAHALELSSRSEDFREGLAAFRDKRAPRFTGR